MSTTHETYGDNGGWPDGPDARSWPLATLAAFAIGGGLVRYGLSEVWAIGASAERGGVAALLLHE